MAYSTIPVPDIKGRDMAARRAETRPTKTLEEELLNPLKLQGVSQPALFETLDSWYRPIGLIGYSGSGKDWLASQLTKDRDEPRFWRVSFADKIRALALQIDPVLMHDSSGRNVHLKSLVETFGWTEAKKNREVRRLLQEIGLGVRDLVSEDAWLNGADVIGYARQSPVVVTDVRFPNEARLIERLDGILVRVLRPGVGPVNDHRSEVALDGWSTQMVVWNDPMECEGPDGSLQAEAAIPVLARLGRRKTHGRQGR